MRMPTLHEWQCWSLERDLFVKALTEDEYLEEPQLYDNDYKEEYEYYMSEQQDDLPMDIIVRLENPIYANVPMKNWPKELLEKAL
jgi:hypothetical protein